MTDLTTLDNAALERLISDIDDRGWALADDDSVSQEELDRLAVEQSLAKEELYMRTRDGLPRCESCGAFLPKKPENVSITYDGDNLYTWTCKRCGEEHEECY